jgi:hypothetical protein
MDYVYGTVSGYSTAQGACSAGGQARVEAANVQSPQPNAVRIFASAVATGLSCELKWHCNNPSTGVTTQNCATVTMTIVQSGSNACAAKAGKPGITNWTVGYSRTPEGDDLNMVGSVNKIPSNGMVCDSGCVVEMGAGKTVWQSQTPTDQGLYRWSLDVVSVPTGAECTATSADAPANKTTPNPTCPGYVGEINGVKGCYGTASNPVNVVQADRPSSLAQPGNPAAGEKPLTGEGSGSTGAGRTPASGTGGAAGGPASAAINAKGSGTIAKPADGQEQQACGAPGQPPCRIDESGTPTGGTSFDRAKTD